VPRVSTTAVEFPELIIPVWSLLPVVVALVFALEALRRRPALPLALTRVMLVVAVIFGPLGNVAIALPASVGSVPSPDQAKRILDRLLPNIYQAFEFPEEGAVIDLLPRRSRVTAVSN
jgi:hypothetical protein